MQELIKRLEKDKWHVSGVDIQEAINLLESQAAEIGVLKIAHEAHQTNNLKMLAVLKKQAASIEHYKSGLTSAIQDIEKYRALCDQMAYAMEIHGSPLLHHELRYNEALEAWRA